MSQKKTQSLARVLTVARSMFMERPFDEVSVAQIAAAARCSTSTIYEVFGSKSDLFGAALGEIPASSLTLTRGDGPPSLKALVDYFLRRVALLQGTRALLRSASRNPKAVSRSMRRALELDGALAATLVEVQRCIDAGLLRPGEPQAIAYLMYAGCGFEPVMYGLLFGEEATVDGALILRTVFSQLVTEQGQAELDDLLPKPAEAEPPGAALTGFLRKAASVPGETAREDLSC